MPVSPYPSGFGSQKRDRESDDSVLKSVSVRIEKGGDKHATEKHMQLSLVAKDGKCMFSESDWDSHDFSGALFCFFPFFGSPARL